MNSRIQHQEFTLPKYGKLLDRLNDMAMGIKIHHIIREPQDEEEKRKIEKARAHRPPPTWENVVALLEDAVDVLQQDRYNPVKY